MPSDLTIIVSKAGAPLASSILQPTIARADLPPPKEQINTGTQIAAIAATTSLKPKSEETTVQVPKRVEPNYTRGKRKKRATPGELSDENTLSKELDVEA